MTDAQPSTSLTIKLVTDELGVEPKLATFDLLRDRMRHRITPSKVKRKISNVFAPDFVEQLKEALSKLTERSMVYAYPDYAANLEQVRFEELQMVNVPNKLNGQTSYLTFVRMFGEARSLFAPMKSPVLSATTDIAVETLETVANRTYDITHSHEQIMATNHDIIARDRLAEISKKRDELLFRLLLLDRATSQAKNLLNHGPSSQQPLLT